MWSYSKRLERDVARWKANGWLTPAGEKNIAAEISRGGGGVTLASALAVIAAVLLGFAAISFVAANWQDMPRLGRLAVLIASIWICYAAAGVFAGRGAAKIADAAILLGTAVYGASIMLVSQMYHIDGNPPDAVLVWWIGALVAGVLLRSNPVLAFALVLVCVWAAMESNARNEIYWPFLIGWALVSAAFYWHGWRPGLHLSALALSIFLVYLGYWRGHGIDHKAIVVIGLAATLATAAIDRLKPEFSHIAAPLLGYAIAVTFAALFALQFFHYIGRLHLMIYAVSALILVIGAISYGWMFEHRGALWLGYIGFSIEVIGIYWRTIGSILSTSAFFLTVGMLVAGLAFLALRLKRGSDHGKGERAPA